MSRSRYLHLLTQESMPRLLYISSPVSSIAIATATTLCHERRICYIQPGSFLSAAGRVPSVDRRCLLMQCRTDLNLRHSQWCRSRAPWTPGARARQLDLSPSIHGGSRPTMQMNRDRCRGRGTTQHVGGPLFSHRHHHRHHPRRAPCPSSCARAPCVRAP